MTPVAILLAVLAAALLVLLIRSAKRAHTLHAAAYAEGYQQRATQEARIRVLAREHLHGEPLTAQQLLGLISVESSLITPDAAVQRLHRVTQAVAMAAAPINLDQGAASWN
ncbi:hypothetical protein [Deinococcus kurensis]|uniref:hypothetical protein n=1 Tax=Deinococcus kurensis TaxID=2662757 RepID=UPI0012D2DAB4|nr:hypothetical protein [Deinococcus kurensis]